MTLTERLGIGKYVDLKSLIFGSAIATTLVIIGSRGGSYEWAYPFSSIGLLYVGYKSKNIKMGAILGAIAAIPLMILGYYGGFGEVPSSSGFILMAVILALVGAFVGFVGAYAKQNREKAKIEYEKKQKIGKNKKKNKKEK